MYHTMNTFMLLCGFRHLQKQLGPPQVESYFGEKNKTNLQLPNWTWRDGWRWRFSPASGTRKL